MQMACLPEHNVMAHAPSLMALQQSKKITRVFSLMKPAISLSVPLPFAKSQMSQAELQQSTHGEFARQVSNPPSPAVGPHNFEHGVGGEVIRSENLQKYTCLRIPAWQVNPTLSVTSRHNDLPERILLQDK